MSDPSARNRHVLRDHDTPASWPGFENVWLLLPLPHAWLSQGASALYCKDLALSAKKELHVTVLSKPTARCVRGARRVLCCTRMNPRADKTHENRFRCD